MPIYALDGIHPDISPDIGYLAPSATIIGDCHLGPEVGIWFLVAVAVIGGGVLSMMLLRLIQGRVQAIDRARGENPLF